MKTILEYSAKLSANINIYFNDGDNHFEEVITKDEFCEELGIEIDASGMWAYDNYIEFGSSIDDVPLELWDPGPELVINFINSRLAKSRIKNSRAALDSLFKMFGSLYQNQNAA